MVAVALPETAHGSFRRPRAFAGRARAAHFHDGPCAGGGGDAAAHEAPDATILHRNVAGGTRQVVVLVAKRAKLRRVIGKSEISPVERALTDALRDQMPDRQRVLDLLQHETREHGEDLGASMVVELVDGGQQARIPEREILLVGAKAERGILLTRRSLVHVREAHVVAAVRAHGEAAALGQTIDAERREERMQQACMVSVLDVLEVELPVVREDLREAAGDDDRLVRTRLIRAATSAPRYSSIGGTSSLRPAEHEPSEKGDPQLARAVVGAAEALVHAALPGDALLEGDRLEVAFRS